MNFKASKSYLSSLAIILSASCFADNGESFSWHEVIQAHLATPRAQHSMVLLQNGMVLIVGNRNNTCEVFDPINDTCEATASMNYDNGNSTCFVLNSGKVLVVGRGKFPYSKCELYDPKLKVWVETGSLNTPRRQIYATMLTNGTVLVAGGRDKDQVFVSCEIYNPKTGKWTEIASLNTPRSSHSIVSLANGKALVFGGEDTGESFIKINGDARGKTCEIYDPVTNRWIDAAPLLVNHGSSPLVVRLKNGHVLVVGGEHYYGGGCVIMSKPELSCERYDPATNRWSKAADIPYSTSHTSTLTNLRDGAVVLTNIRSANSIFYDSKNDKWHKIPQPITPRFFHAITQLSNDDILISGGAGKNGALYDFEILKHTELAKAE